MNLKQAKELVRGRLSDKRYAAYPQREKNGRQAGQALRHRPGAGRTGCAFHYAAKEMPKDEMRAMMRRHTRNTRRAARHAPRRYGTASVPPFWPVPNGALRTKPSLSAIACHTAGKAGMTQLDKILIWPI